MPEGMEPPEGFDPETMGGGRGQRPDNWEEMTPPEGFDGEMPTWPEGEEPQMPEGGFGERGNMASDSGKPSTDFYMNDKVNAFSNVMETAEKTA